MDVLSNFFSTTPLDWLILAAVVVILVLDALRSGIGRAAAIALALPLAAFFFSLIPVSAYLKDVTILNNPGAVQVGLFGLLFALSYLLIRRMSFDFIDSGSGEPLQAILASAAAMVVIIVIWLHMPVLNELRPLGEPFASVFSDLYRLWWLIGAYAILAFARG